MKSDALFNEDRYIVSCFGCLVVATEHVMSNLFEPYIHDSSFVFGIHFYKKNYKTNLYAF